jgi:glycosyltransferase involved in cell wall biosynthesis
MSARLRVRFLVDPRDPSPPWSTSVLGEPLLGAGDAIDVRASVGPLAEVDLVHAFGGRAADAARAGCGSGRVPWVLSLREGSRDDSSDLGELGRRASGADAVLVRSSALADRLTRAGIARTRSFVLPVGVDTATFVRRGPMANRTPRHRLVIELAEAQTGLEVALEVVARQQDLELVVLGSADQQNDLGPRIDALLARADALGVRERVVVAWIREPREKAWWLRSAHVVLALAGAPGRPDFVAEAMACGVAVVATPVEAQREIVVHGVTGLLVTENDQASVRRAIRDVVHDEFLVEALGLAGADRALGRLGWDQVAAELASAYDRVLGRAGAELPTEDDDELDQTG